MTEMASALRKCATTDCLDFKEITVIRMPPSVSGVPVMIRSSVLLTTQHRRIAISRLVQEHLAVALGGTCHQVWMSLSQRPTQEIRSTNRPHVTLFCVLRDPMQRFLSQFSWDIRFWEGNEERCNAESFEDWAARKLTGLNLGVDCHYVPQVYYVFENGDYKHGRQICRHVIKTDDLETKFPSLMKQYDLDVELAGPHWHFFGKCDLTPTPKTVEMVKTFYAGDYSAFGF